MIITKNGKPIAALVSIDDAVLVEEAKDNYYNALVDEAANEEADMMPFEDFIADVEADETE